MIRVVGRLASRGDGPVAVPCRRDRAGSPGIRALSSQGAPTSSGPTVARNPLGSSRVGSVGEGGCADEINVQVQLAAARGADIGQFNVVGGTGSDR